MARVFCLRGIIATMMLALMLTIGLSDCASAHATLVSTDPPEGAVVADEPVMVQLHFNEAVAPSSIKLIDAEGNERKDAVLRARGDTIGLTLPQGLPQGTQVVSYRIVSLDGHPVAGAMMFSIGHVTGASAPATSPWRGAVIWLTRLMLYLGLFGGVGGVVFAIFIARIKTPLKAKRRQPQLDALLALGAISALASLALQGLDLLDGSIASLLTAAPWRAALATTLAPQLGVAVLAMIAACVALRTKPLVAKLLTAFALLGVGAALAASGHAAQAEPQWLTKPSIFLHGIAVTYWAGALLPLFAMLRQAGPYAAMTVPVLERFSRGAVFAVAALVGTGVAVAVLQLDRVSAFVDTAYGNLLAFKLLMVLGLLLLAALNRYVLTPKLQSGGSTTAFVRSIAIEGVLVVAILGVVAGWRFTPPPRALDAVAQDSLNMHLHTAEGMVEVTITPGKVGKNDIVLQFMDEDLTTVRVKDATLSLTQQDESGATKEIEGLGTTHAFERPDGTREADGVVIPQPGRWSMRIEGLISDFKEITLEGPFLVPGK